MSKISGMKDEYVSMRDELMQLMLNFKVCYEIPGTPNHYIAPHLLSTDKAEYDWNEKNNLILRYEYEFMPKGILTRFIVDMHRYIEEKKQVWKNGVVLQNHYGRAKIIENYRPSKGEIKIRVSGFDKKALMAVITNKFFEIHSSFERLRYQTFIPCNCSLCKSKTSPNEFPLDRLHKFLKDGKPIQCPDSYDMVNVQGLLDDVNFSTDPRDKDRPSREDNGEPDPPKKSPTRDQVFISYSHQNKGYLEELQTHLKPMIKKNQFPLWDDTKINAGEEWRKEIEIAIQKAKIAVLLVSPAFLASDFIDEDELPPLLDARSEGLVVIWIPLTYSNYEETEIAKYQAAHSPSKPLDSLSGSDRNKAWVEICKKIKQAATEK